MIKEKILRRKSTQRKIILDELKKLKTHPRADLLFKIVRKKLPNISFGTVYRNLNLLRDQGEILELTCGKHSCRYDGTVTNHYHFFCLKCERVFDLDEPVLRDLDMRVSKKSGMAVNYHRIDFYGYCRECKSRNMNEDK
ncbi:MAG: transcriptional repressor [Candidatus Omnitrophota bacterium]|nr:transcriptional repressor [Candidatus Omnitrophota bacterium]